MAAEVVAEGIETEAELDTLRESLGLQVGQSGPWIGPLRRLLKASSAESSVSIEGYSVPEREAIAIVSGPKTADAQREPK